MICTRVIMEVDVCVQYVYVESEMPFYNGFG